MNRSSSFLISSCPPWWLVGVAIVGLLRWQVSTWRWGRLGVNFLVALLVVILLEEVDGRLLSDDGVASVVHQVDLVLVLSWEHVDDRLLSRRASSSDDNIVLVSVRGWSDENNLLSTLRRWSHLNLVLQTFLVSVSGEFAVDGEVAIIPTFGSSVAELVPEALSLSLNFGGDDANAGIRERDAGCEHQKQLHDFLFFQTQEHNNFLEIIHNFPLKIYLFYY